MILCKDVTKDGCNVSILSGRSNFVANSLTGIIYFHQVDKLTPAMFESVNYDPECERDPNCAYTAKENHNTVRANHSTARAINHNTPR